MRLEGLSRPIPRMKKPLYVQSWPKKFVLGLRDLAIAPSGRITQPRTKIFGQLCRYYYEPTTSLLGAGAPGAAGRPAILSVNSGARSPRAGIAINASSFSGGGGTGGMCGCSQETFLSLANQIRDVIPAGPPGKAALWRYPESPRARPLYRNSNIIQSCKQSLLAVQVIQHLICRLCLSGRLC